MNSLSPVLARRALACKREWEKENGKKRIGKREEKKKKAESSHLMPHAYGNTRKIGASKELSRKEREAEERENGIGGGDDDDDDDDDDGMDL